MRRTAVALCLAGAAWSCRGPVQPIPSRLLAPAEARFQSIGSASRPSLSLSPGESRRFTVQARKGSRLWFSWARQGYWRKGRLVIRVSGRVVVSRPVGGPAAQAWNSESVPIEQEGPVEIEMRTEGPYFGPPGGEAPAVVVGAPRVYFPGPARRRRTLIWISVDAARADHLGAYGYARNTSPHFDRLCQQAAVFESASAPASWTLPSLASQFTARYPSYHGAVLDDLRRNPAHPTLFEVLARSGFTVVGLTANPFVAPAFNLASGFDALSATTRNAGKANRLALEALTDWTGGDLAFFIHYIDPHVPYAPPPPFRDLFDSGRGSRFSGAAFPGPGSPEDPAFVGRVQALYDGEIAFADRMTGALLAALDQLGLLGDAVIVYSADHGEEFLDHGGWKHGHTLYEELLRVPFAVRAPGIRAQRVKTPVSLIDIAPTVLDLFGLSAPASFQGRSLVPVLRGDRRPAAPIYAETQRTPDGLRRLSVREENLKLILTIEPGAEQAVRKEELYDLAADPRERLPIFDPLAAGRLRKQGFAFLRRAVAESGSAKPLKRTSEVDAQLRALGYIQ